MQNETTLKFIRKNYFNIPDGIIDKEGKTL